MIIISNDEEQADRLKRRLFREFEMKDIGNLKYFLGIEVLRSNKGIFTNPRKYIMDLSAKTGLVDYKPAKPPIMMNHGLRIIKAGQFHKERYHKLVGKLIYLAHTRPDISYVVGVVNRFMHKPQVKHLDAILRILKYINGKTGRGLRYRNN